MSAENKINIKNAFSLHLIDVISDLTNEKSRVNFEVAGTTIRAGVKIYSYRVDNVYQEAYRVASRLGIEPGKKGNQDKEEQRREGAASPECPVTKRKRPRKQLVGSTIEKNLANITTDAEDFNCDIDPLFEKFRNAFGAGSPAALFMNMLPTSSKSNQLLLCCADSQAAVDEEALLMRDQQLINSIESDPEISKVIDFVARNTYTTLAPSLALLQSENSDQTSQIEDEPLTLAADGQDYNYFNNVEKGELDDQMNENGSIDDEDECDVQKNGTVQKFATLDLIASAVSSKPLDYSYFEPAAMITLAGPNHWKVNYLRQLRTNQLKSKGGADDADIVPKKSKQQARRPLTRIDFDEQLDFGELLQVAKRSTITLSNTTLERYMQRDYTLDSDIDFDPNRFKYLFIKNIPMRKTAVVSENCVNGDQVTVYNYKNAVDNDNFCPDLLPDGENENDDAAEPFDLPSSSSSSPTIGHPEVKGVDEAKTDSEFDQQLLPQPFKVNKIEIAFEKCAKRIDVLQLKESMWKIINDGSIPHGVILFSFNWLWKQSM
ncbi:unnamed protein product [Soboliphyme baturini]|uniref:Condensin complex subunit 2 n=1 Tax=Soboliphyme baturini TaxID=241478 RepID=A0A183IKV7_9BILA|nr:unnamed protein product [Soboliphyme baturini]